MKKLLYLFVVTSIFLSSCSKNCPIPEAQEEWLFVHTAESAKILNATTIVMPLVDDIFAFTDRPYRKSYHMTGQHYAELWIHQGENCFQDDPPNAVLTWVDGGESKEIEVVITHAVLDSTSITYTIWDDSGIITEDIVYPSLFVDGANSQIKIGDRYAGGIVFHLDGNGGGLIAAPSDYISVMPPFSLYHKWSDNQALFSGTIDRTGIGTGHQNTKDIIAVAEPSGAWTAAHIATQYEIYSDWFLPSKDELNLMYFYIGQGSLLGNIGGFAENYYWSSTEEGAYGAWRQDFKRGDQEGGGKGDPYGDLGLVRAVRAF